MNRNLLLLAAALSVTVATAAWMTARPRPRHEPPGRHLRSEPPDTRAFPADSRPGATANAASRHGAPGRAEPLHDAAAFQAPPGDAEDAAPPRPRPPEAPRDDVGQAMAATTAATRDQVSDAIGRRKREEKR